MIDQRVAVFPSVCGSRSFRVEYGICRLRYVHVSPTVEGEGMREGQHGDVPAVVVNVGIHKGQVAAVVNDGLHLGHGRVDRLVVDGAQQHTPAIHEAIPPAIETALL